MLFFQIWFEWEYQACTNSNQQDEDNSSTIFVAHSGAYVWFSTCFVFFILLSDMIFRFVFSGWCFGLTGGIPGLVFIEVRWTALQLPASFLRGWGGLTASLWMTAGSTGPRLTWTGLSESISMACSDQWSWIASLIRMLLLFSRYWDRYLDSCESLCPPVAGIPNLMFTKCF